MTDDLLKALIPAICLERFNQAVQLANDGDRANALDQFQHIFDRDDGQSLQGSVTGEFLATVEFQKANCLMHLGRPTEAQAIFQQLDRGLAGQLNTETIYDFYVAYGNTLGQLGQLPDMIDRMAHAMNIALERLRDLDRFRQVWYWVLYWEKQHQAWDLLDEHCIDANGFGLENNDLQLQIIALEFRCHAHRALGRLDQARTGAAGVLAWKRQVPTDRAAIQEWEDFWVSVGGSLDSRG